MSDALWIAVIGVAASPIVLVLGAVGRLVWRGLHARVSKPPPPPPSVRVSTNDPRIAANGRAIKEANDRVAAMERRIDTVVATMGTALRDVDKLGARLEKLAEEGTRSHATVQRELGEISGMLARLDGDAE